MKNSCVIIVAIISAIVGCTNSTKRAKKEALTAEKWNVTLVGECEFPEGAFGSREFMNDSSFIIISEVASMDTALYGKNFYLKQLQLSKTNKILEIAPKSFPTAQMRHVIDSLNLKEIKGKTFESIGQSNSKLKEGVFFHKTYPLPLNKTYTLQGEIIGRNESATFVIRDASNSKMANFDLPAGPNYLIKMIDLNNDGTKECLLYNCLMNEVVVMKIFIFEKKQ